MKITREQAMRAATLLGKLHEPELEAEVAKITAREIPWWEVIWTILTSPRAVWIGVKGSWPR